jgi:hypothetical protein
MKKVRLNESDIENLVKRIIKEDFPDERLDWYPLPSEDEFKQKKRDIQQIVRKISQIVASTPYSEDGVDSVYYIEEILYDALQDYLT